MSDTLQLDWKHTQTRSILNMGHFYISYDDGTVAQLGLSFFLPDDGPDETAIVVGPKDDKKFYILNGDFRKMYNDILARGAGLDGCIEFYNEHKEEYQSSWSSDYYDED